MPSNGAARQLYEEGRLGEAIEALSAELREDPGNLRSRTFLFELLCFAGEFDRARKQLDAIGVSDPEQQLTTSWYQEALHALEQRQEMFDSGDLPGDREGSGPITGTLNGEPFEDLRDADPRIGRSLEAIVGGRYTWIPFEHLVGVKAEPPERLRDLFCLPAEIEGTPDLGGISNDILLPVMTPGSWRHPDELVRLGRLTAWEKGDSGEEIPVGQKLLVVDGEDVPLLELRELRFDGSES